MQKIIEQLRLWKNKIRITFLKYFTDRVKDVKITDENGEEHKFTTEQTKEKVCAHKTIREVSHALYKCVDCDKFFLITYKVMLNGAELAEWLKTMANNLKIDLDVDKQTKE